MILKYLKSYLAQIAPIHRSHPAVVSRVVRIPQTSLVQVKFERRSAVKCDGDAGEERREQKEEKVNQVEVPDRVAHQQTVVTVLEHTLIDNSYKEKF